jgi:hypothetical protein
MDFKDAIISDFRLWLYVLPADMFADFCLSYALHDVFQRLTTRIVLIIADHYYSCYRFPYC